MKVITLKGPDHKTTYEVHAYKAGETVEIFKGSTGVFGADAGSESAGLVYVEATPKGIYASDVDVDNANTWAWIQMWMQKGMDSEEKLTK